MFLDFEAPWFYKTPLTGSVEQAKYTIAISVHSPSLLPTKMRETRAETALTLKTQYAGFEGKSC